MKNILLLAAMQILFLSCQKNDQNASFINHVENADAQPIQTVRIPEPDKERLAMSMAASPRFQELRSRVMLSLDTWDELIPFTGDTAAYVSEFTRLSTLSPIKEDIAAIQSLSASILHTFPEFVNYSKADQRYIISKSFRGVRPMKHASCKYGYDNDRDDCRIDAGTETIFNIGVMTVFGGAGFLAGVWAQGGILVKKNQCMQRARRDYLACIAKELKVVIDAPVEGKDYKLINCRYQYNRRLCDTVWITKLIRPVNRINP